MSNYYIKGKGWVIDGQTREEWQEAHRTLSQDELTELGILDATQEDTSTVEKVDELMGYTSRANIPYEKLSVGETLSDIGKAVGTEASKILLRNPANDNALASWIPTEGHYTERTRIAEMAKYGYRYLVPTALMMMSGGVLGLVGGAAKAPQLVKAGSVLSKIMNPTLMKSGTKLAKTVNAMAGGAVAGAIADYNVARPEENEGQFADIFGDTNIKVLEALQSSPDDTETQARLKNTGTGLVLGSLIGAGVENFISPIFKKLGTILSKVEAKEITEEAAAKELEVVAETFDTKINGETLIKQVDEAINKANQENVEDVERYLLNQEFTNSSNQENVLSIYNSLKNGKEPIALDDGSFSIKVNDWRDASDVSIDELKRQFTDEETGLVDAVPLMNKTIKDVWTERGWLADKEELIIKTEPKDNTNEPKSKINTQASNRILKNYTDKFNIKNKVKVEWVDGEIKGADGNTSALINTGKTDIGKKNNQIAIDKKKLQIEKFEEKIAKAESGDKKKDTSKLIETLQKQLKIAKDELKKLEDKSDNKFLLPDITIQINKNSKNPYAVLRSELEHARDIAKGEVPDQSKKHFNRYNGINESEISLEYVKKKADTRAGKELEKQKILDEIGEDVKPNKLNDFVNNKELTETAIKDLFDDDFYVNQGIFKDVGDVKVSKISEDDLQHYKERGTLADAYLEFDDTGAILGIKVNPNLSAEDVEFCVLHELKHLEQIKLAQTDEVLAKEFEEFLALGDNPEKFLEYHNHKFEKEADRHAVEVISRKNQQNGYEKNSGTQQKTQSDMVDSTQRNASREEQGRGIQDSPNESQRGIPSDTTNRPISEQLKATDGDLNAVNKILDDVIARDTELSGTDWKALAEDADKFYDKIKDICGENITAFKKAFNSGDIDLVNYMTRKVLAAERVINNLIEEAKLMRDKGLDASNILDSIHYLQKYTSQIGSAYGRGLHEQVFAKKVRGFFAITTLEKQGLDSFVDLLHKDLTSLNFTRNVKELKEEMYGKLQKYYDGKLWEELMSDPTTSKAFDDMLNHWIGKQDVSEDSIRKLLNNFRQAGAKEELEWLLQNATDNSAIKKGLMNWNTVKTYYISNLLSSPRTQIVNLASGIANSLYNPFKKIVAGLFDKEIGREGQLTYEQLFTNHTLWKDSFDLAKQAWLTGEGNMVNLKPIKPNETDVTEAYTMAEWKTNDKVQQLFNVYTMLNRLMGCTDEFITQLNYRASLKARALQTAEKGAEKLGLKGEARDKYLKEISNDIFNKGFTTEGKPTDIQLYKESREIVYQESLSGNYYDYTTGKNTKLREQTLAMKTAEALQASIVKVPALKFFFPFVRTSTNIMQQALDHNALYAILSPSQRRLITSETREGNLAKAQLITGMMSYGFGLTCAMSGLVTGAAPSDPETKEALYKTGWKPYSIRIGNKYYSYKGYEPLQTVLGFPADMFALMQGYTLNNNSEEPVIAYAKAGAKMFINNFMDKATFRASTSQISNIMNAIETGDENLINTALGQFSRGFMPMVSLGTTVGNMLDPAQSKPSTYGEALWNKYFFTGALGDYKRNVWGERQDQYHLLYTTASVSDDSPEDLELLRLAELGWSVSELSPRDNSTKSNYKDYKSDSTHRSLYDLMLETQSTITIDGKTLRESVAELIDSEDYQLALDGIDIEEQGMTSTKVNQIKAIFKLYKDAAKEQVIREYGDTYYDKNGNTLKEADNALKEAQELKLLEAQIEQNLQDIRSFS